MTQLRYNKSDSPALKKPIFSLSIFSFWARKISQAHALRLFTLCSRQGCERMLPAGLAWGSQGPHNRTTDQP